VKCKRIIDNVEKVLAIELLTAVQAIEFRKPLKTSDELELIIADFRKVVTFNDADRILHDDLLAAIEFIKTYQMTI